MLSFGSVLGGLLVALTTNVPAPADEPRAAASTGVAVSDDTKAAPEDAAPVEAHGVALGVGLASAYVFRGLNLLQDDSQHDPHAVVQPTLAYEIPSSGLTVAYFASYQVTGANRAARVADGTGHEQDVTLSWSRTVGDLEIGTSFAAYTYPFADAEAAGTAVPIYLEPMVSATLSTVVDLGFAASLMAGLQEAIRPSNYIYLNPSVGRAFELSEGVTLDMSSSYGHKLQSERDSTHDVAVHVGATFSPTDRLEVTPAVHWAWTNLDDRGFAEEQVLWASIDLGALL